MKSSLFYFTQKLDTLKNKDGNYFWIEMKTLRIEF